ncbi:MAG: di-trans,poly-cis-decaprenylcistransferase [Armatimonadetes bacterium]|nr:di-trans,poly-cis-decaprenylcistransferase [Armatimonadota bacterium]NOG92666.1 di-trans,poly-cis-decaprenylcistransferase [Armatimonadota bacterium]
MSVDESAASQSEADRIDRLPAHIGIIMDGNGRWATSRGLPRLIGHREGYKTLRSVLLHANDLGIQYLTVYAFSAENWRRPEDEVDGLMQLITQAAIDELRVMHLNNVRVRVAGRLDELPHSLRNALIKGVETTAQNTGITFTLAINYGGRAEIVDAVRRIMREGTTPDEVTEETISRCLYNPDIPEPDLLIRTAGELRLSNFLLWQGAYAELYVVQKPWPEFTPEDLEAACQEYARRVRKFGAVAPRPASP